MHLDVHWVESLQLSNNRVSGWQICRLPYRKLHTSTSWIATGCATHEPVSWLWISGDIVLSQQPHCQCSAIHEPSAKWQLQNLPQVFVPQICPTVSVVHGAPWTVHLHCAGKPQGLRAQLSSLQLEATLTISLCSVSLSLSLTHRYTHASRLCTFTHQV